MRRIITNRKVKKTILIVCQGKVTEPEYFKYFRDSYRISNLDIKISHINESDTLKFTKKAIKDFEQEFRIYEECWIVFDKDENSENSFNGAINYAKQKNWYVAYSNQAFEFWLILHYERYFGQLHRSDYKDRLSRHLGFEYLKNDKPTIAKICKIIEPNLHVAIKYSISIYDSFPAPRNPAREESSTTVHLLVEEIIKYFQ